MFDSLPQSVKTALQNILAKEAHQLVELEIDLLKARRDYLTPEQISKFASVLGLQPQAQQQPETTPEQTLGEKNVASPVVEPTPAQSTSTVQAPLPAAGTQYETPTTEEVPTEEPVEETEIVTNDTEDENPYGGSSADPDQA